MDREHCDVCGALARGLVGQVKAAMGGISHGDDMVTLAL